MRKLILLVGFLATGCGACVDLPLIFADPMPTRSLPGPGLDVHGGGSVVFTQKEYEVRPAVGLGGAVGSRFRLGGYLRGGAVYWFDDCDSTWKTWPVGTLHLVGGVQGRRFNFGADLFAGAPLFLGGSLSLGLGNPETFTLSVGLPGVEAKVHWGPFTAGALFYYLHEPIFGAIVGFGR